VERERHARAEAECVADESEAWLPTNWGGSVAWCSTCKCPAGAVRNCSSILKDFGWGVVDVGGIESSRYLEAMCMVWVLSAMRTNNWNQAFKLLRT
jgi:hypothetical protein